MKTFKIVRECCKGEGQGAARTHKKEIFHNRGSQEEAIPSCVGGEGKDRKGKGKSFSRRSHSVGRPCGREPRT